MEDPGSRELSVFTGISLKLRRSRWRLRTTIAPCLQRQKTSTVQTPTTTRSTPKSRDSPHHLTHSTAEIPADPSAFLDICPVHHQTPDSEKFQLQLFLLGTTLYLLFRYTCFCCMQWFDLTGTKGLLCVWKGRPSAFRGQRGRCRLHVIFGLYIKHYGTWTESNAYLKGKMVSLSTEENSHLWVFKLSTTRFI